MTTTEHPTAGHEHSDQWNLKMREKSDSHDVGDAVRRSNGDDICVDS
jgi:hypothetical protein